MSEQYAATQQQANWYAAQTAGLANSANQSLAGSKQTALEETVGLLRQLVSNLGDQACRLENLSVRVCGGSPENDAKPPPTPARPIATSYHDKLHDIREGLLRLNERMSGTLSHIEKFV